jgi:archaemetzincin
LYRRPRAQQLAAIGPISGLPDRLRRALEPGDDFLPVPAPGPGDWLANHPEPGQSFEEFLHSRHHRPEARRRVLYLQPLGKWDQDEGPSLVRLRQFMADFFGMEVVVLPVLDLARVRVASRKNPRAVSCSY